MPKILHNAYNDDYNDLRWCCLPYRVNRLMHTDKRTKQQHSFYYSHMPKITLCLNDNYNDFPRCTYTIPKNLPEGVHRLHVGYKLFTDDVGYTIQYLPTKSTRPLQNVYRQHHPPQKKKSSLDDNYKISETD